MRRFKYRNLPFLAIVVGTLLAGCGGGGGDTPAQNPGPSGPLSVLAWDPPANYADNAALDPYRDLEHYEIFARQDRNFTDNDLPVAVVAAVVDAPASGGGNPASKILEKEFILENLTPFLGQGNRYYISLKVVGIDGQKSAFMPPVAWDRI